MSYRKTYVLALSVLTSSVLVAVSLFWAPIARADGFQAGRIVDDSVFYDKNSMNADQIQAFLNAKVPQCDTNGTKTASNGQTRAQYSADRGVSTPFICLKDYHADTVNKNPDDFCGGFSASNKTAAQIIYDVAQSCGVSPKVLIVLLQKEQSLITDDWPWPVQYQKATGYACPDTSPCDAQYYGLFNQVYSAARQFRVYQAYPNSYNHIPRANNNIRYNPNTGCGSSTVYIENQATAGLYNYTPYQPNQAVLSGSSDSCSAYGNYNFWKTFNNWFGQTIYAHPLLGYTPAAVSQANGKTNVFARGEDGRLWQTWFQYGKWQGWNYVDGPSFRSSAPSAISLYDGHLDTFETRNGEIWHTWYLNDSTGWRPWGPIGKPGSAWLGGSMTAVTQAYNKINIFARGNDGRLWQTWFENGQWRGWNYIDGPRSGVSAPASISYSDGHMDVFEIRDGAVWHSWYSSSGGWRPWAPLGQPGSTKLKGTLAVVSQAYGKINVFARGEDGRLWQTWFQNGKWNGWNYIDGPTFNASSPTAMSWSDGHMEIMEVKDGKLRHKWYFSNSGWSGWESLGTP